VILTHCKLPEFRCHRISRWTCLNTRQSRELAITSGVRSWNGLYSYYKQRPLFKLSTNDDVNYKGPGDERMQWRTQEIFSGGGGVVQRIQLRTGQRERGSGGGSPLVRGSTQFANKWNPYSDTLFRMYIPRNWEFGSALSKLWNFGPGGGGVNPPPPGTPVK
jgi:hypothetical protein